jgi:hypothetical protein
MPSKPPQFKVGDKVCKRFPVGETIPEVGTVIIRYRIEDQYRYVVKFEDGRYGMFFGRELLLSDSKD